MLHKNLHIMMSTFCISTRALFFIFTMQSNTASINLNLLSRKLLIKGRLVMYFSTQLIPIKKLLTFYARNFSQPRSYLSKVAGNLTIPRHLKASKYPTRQLSTIFLNKRSLTMMSSRKISISSSSSNNNPKSKSSPSKNLIN